MSDVRHFKKTAYGSNAVSCVKGTQKELGEYVMDTGQQVPKSHDQPTYLHVVNNQEACCVVSHVTVKLGLKHYTSIINNMVV